jgi:NADPH2:quinone reductase
VIAAVGREAKKAAAQASGADMVVNYAEADWVQQVRTATAGKGVAAVFDAVGGPVGTAALHALEAGGTCVVYGAASGEPTRLEAQQLIGQRQVVRGYTVFAEMARFGEYTDELLGYFRLASCAYPSRPTRLRPCKPRNATWKPAGHKAKWCYFFEELPPQRLSRTLLKHWGASAPAA